ncbi:MAG: hypothetical protein Q8P59_07110, partial [Dehalococcoidia bacterium]|nr:hypothetical protein [Dehalococcoidia bacterium]
AAVSAGSGLNPHVSQRQSLYLFPEIKDAENVLLDVSANTYPIDGPSQRRVAMDLIKGGQWGIVAADDGYLLLGKGVGGSSFPDRFFDFARANDPKIAHPLEATFGPLRLIGYDIEPRGALHGKDPYANLTLYWRALEAPKKDYGIAVFLISPSNSVVANLTRHAATIWYPTSQWRMGEVIKVVVPRIPLAGYSRGEVQLGIVDGPDENNPELRLRPKVLESPQLVPLNGDQTLLRLRTLEVK